MRLNSTTLFILPAIIWGSTWLVITFQLGVVDPTWSVSYRFLLAGFLLILYCLVFKRKLRFSWIDHLRFFQQGILLFGLNYWLVYMAEQVLVSALVAIAFSTIIFLNIMFGTLFLKRKTTSTVYFGASMGFIGTILLFYEQLKNVSFESLPVKSIILCLLSVVIASLGNITSAANQQKALPVIQTNAYGMLYGGISMALIAILSGIPITFDISFAYISSLVYLTVLGSIVAFGTYLTLIGRIGPEKAAYVLITIPLISIILSALFEGFSFGLAAVAGIGLILAGNLFVLRR